MIAEGQFREDLLFRLNMFHVHLPPLRERRPDIPDLARHLLARAAKRPVEEVADLLTPEALQVMLDYDWQGNVRELANAMEYAWIVSGGQPIAPGAPAARRAQPAVAASVMPRAAMPVELLASVVRDRPPRFPSRRRMPPQPRPRSERATKSLADVEMEYILQVYAKNNMNKQATATELGISLKTLYNKLHKYEEERRMRAG